MFDFFKKQKLSDDAPSYWLNYLALFNSKQNFNKLISETKFIILDVESTGLDHEKDRILSIGAVEVFNNQIDLANTFELYIDQKEYSPDTAAIHGILKEGNKTKLTEEKAIEEFIDYLQGNIIVGHSIGFDLSILNVALKKYVDGKLLNKSLDTIDLYKRLKGAELKLGESVSLDELSKEFNIPQSDRHNAAGDAYITALLFMKIIARLKNRGVINLSDLMKRKRLLF